MIDLPKKLFKTTIILWSEVPGDQYELDELAREATSGNAYCSKQETIEVDPRQDKDWDGTEFFGVDHE
jgi:hypothetical protein